MAVRFGCQVRIELSRPKEVRHQADISFSSHWCENAKSPLSESVIVSRYVADGEAIETVPTAADSKYFSSDLQSVNTFCCRGMRLTCVDPIRR